MGGYALGLEYMDSRVLLTIRHMDGEPSRTGSLLSEKDTPGLRKLFYPCI